MSMCSLVQKRPMVTHGRFGTATHSNICVAEGRKIDSIYELVTHEHFECVTIRTLLPHNRPLCDYT